MKTLTVPSGFFCLLRNMIQPPFLKKGDIIGIPATARKISREALAVAVQHIESWGFRVRLGKNIFSTTHSYLSGSDDERVADLQQMLDDHSIQAILCARGGYGTTRILDQLDFTAFLKNPKWVCGFSDITALHLKLQSLNVQSIHSTMPVLFKETESSTSIESFRKILLGENTALEASTHSLNLSGKASGKVVGGNLSLLVDSLGTNSELDTEHKILIVEEIDEYIYKIDRLFVQLKRAGKLKNLSGLVVGHLTDIEDSELPFGESVHQVILNQIKEYNYPVGFGFPIGHENPNLAWIEGAIGNLSVTKEKSTLSF